MLENLNDIAESLSSVSYGHGYQTGLVQQITDFLAELGFASVLLKKPGLLGLRLWWNWQTRYFEVVVGQPVQVQVLLSAPFLFLRKHQ